MRVRSKLAAAGIVTLMTGGLAACGSSDNESDSSASDASTASKPASSAVASAQAEVKKWSASQAPISVPPLGTPAPKGKSIAVITCPLPVCQTETNSSVRSAKQLGWSVKSYTNPLTPEGYAAAWDKALQGKPDGVVYIGALPNAIIRSQLATAAQAKIPAIDIAPAGDTPSKTGPVFATYVNKPHLAASGRLQGQIVVADNGPKPKVAFVWDPTFESLIKAQRGALTEVVEGAGGSVDTVNVSAQQVGKSMPAQLVTYLRRNPGVKYMVFQLDDFTAGLPQALQAAGLGGKVKLITRSPQATGLKAIQSGDTFASIAEENDTGGYRAVDALARLFAGKTDFDANPAGWRQIITKDNVDAVKPDPAGAPATPGSPETFLKAWGIGG